jgi:hypothetical protein
MDAEKVDLLIEQIRVLNSRQDWGVIQHEISMLLAGIPLDEPHDSESLTPIDVPIEMLPVDGTGQLRVRFPYQLGRRGTLAWQSFSITRGAQERLFQILDSVRWNWEGFSSQDAPKRRQ